MLGLFNQFKYIPLKACPLVLELELVSNFADCIVAASGFPASEEAPNDFKNTSGQLELYNCLLQCDLVSLDNDLRNQYVAHLLDGKELPVNYNTYTVSLVLLSVDQQLILLWFVLSLNLLPHSSPSKKQTLQVHTPKFIKNTIYFVIL